MAVIRGLETAGTAPRVTDTTGRGARQGVVSPVEPVSASSASPGDLTADLSDRLAGRLSISSHSVSLSTRFFHLDYTWRSLDIDAPAQGPLRPDPEPAVIPRVAAPATRREVLRRMKLASLLDDPAPTSSAPGPAAPPAERMACQVRGRLAYFGPQGDA